VRKGTRAIVIVLIGLLGATGCGGGGSSLSKAEYRQQVELICNRGLQAREEFLAHSNEEAEALKAKGEKISLKDGLRRYMGVYEGTTEEIADLDPPGESEKKAEELVQAREAVAAEAAKHPVHALFKSRTTFDKPNKVAEDLGVASCGK
jgi:hypothetical protein